jgi:hypothetical protein
LRSASAAAGIEKSVFGTEEIWYCHPRVAN